MNNIGSATPLAMLENIRHPLAEQLGIELSVLRLDQSFGSLSGNKYFKLINNFRKAEEQGCQCIISFGGAYSNHIHALAMAGKMTGITTIGMIRGELTTPLNPTLQDAVDAGMELQYLSREQYRYRNDPVFLQKLSNKYSNCLVIPEGGGNLDGVIGCQKIVDQIYRHCGNNFDVIALACGTGATLAGVASVCDSSKRIMGFSVLKNSHYLNNEVHNFLDMLGHSDKNNWTIDHNNHFGGYAKIKPELLSFIDEFKIQYNIGLEPIYTGKMFYGFFELLKKSPELFSSGEKVVLIHTGGMQGLRGMMPEITRINALAKVNSL